GPAAHLPRERPGVAPRAPQRASVLDGQVSLRPRHVGHELRNRRLLDAVGEGDAVRAMNTNKRIKTMRFHRVPRTLGILAGAGCLLASGLAQASNSDPPTSPTIPAESVDDSSLTVVWQKPTNYATVTGYKVYNGSTLLCTAGTG